MTVATSTNIPAFCQGIQHFKDNLPGFEEYGQEPAIKAGEKAIAHILHCFNPHFFQGSI